MSRRTVHPSRAGTAPLWTLLTCFLLLLHKTNGQQHVATFQTEEGQDSGTYIGNIVQASGITGPFFLSPDPSDTELLTHLSIDEQTGVIRSGIRLDRETRDFYELLAVSTSLGQVVTVTVQVLDVNDNSPTFPTALTELELSESTPVGVKRNIASAVDADEGVLGVQRYEINSGNVGSAFRLDARRGGDGVLYPELVVSSALDKETVPEYNLMIYAYDGGTPPRSGSTTVRVRVGDVNDNQPIFTQSRYSAEVLENATVGTSVLDVTASDQDEGPNGAIIYGIDRRQSDPEEFFAINSDTGVISVNKPLDFEERSVHELIVFARDNATQPERTTAFVSVSVLDVNDNLPTIDITFLNENQSASVSEGAEPGDFVARISVSDSDNGENVNVNVTLEGGDGRFGLTTQDNIIYLVVVARPLDRELVPNYQIKVIARDSGLPPLTVDRTIMLQVTDINDNAPEFVGSYAPSLSEAVPIGTSVTQITARDRDIGSNAEVSYAILSTPLTHSDWFAVDPESGLITTRSIVDREIDPSPRITISATDHGTPPLSATIEVDITLLDFNDNEPIFNPTFYNATVSEDEDVGHCIVQVSASDPDEGVNGVVTYSFPQTPIARQLPFEIRSDSGWICMTQTLDHDTEPSKYDFSVTAKDGGNLDATAWVSIFIEDINDNHPEFYPLSYPADVQENSPVGLEVVSVTASDRDSGIFGRLTYRIVSGNSDGKFAINPVSGLITVAGPLNSGQQSVHNLAISATDGGGLVSLVNANVAVSVIGTGEMPPVFSQARYSFSVPEDAARQHTVGTVMAAHSDPGKTDPITYSIHSGDRSGYFAIDPTTGRLYTQLNLDHETVSSLLLNIQASSGNPPVYGRAQVNITILDINDNRPEFTVMTESVAITENTSPGTIIFVASAQDRDSGNNGLVRYTLLNNPDNLFSVNSINGEVKILRSVDADNDNPLRYELKIKAHDQGTPQRFSNLTLLVIIQDENDNGPMFSPTFYDVQVPESALVNYRFLQVTALDRDSGLNEFITYYLANSADSPNFGMFPDGWLYVKHRLDRELRDSYFLQVIARDNGSPPRNATANVRVTVMDDNDNDPRFTQESYHFSLVENLPTGTTVGTVFAVDADVGSNADLDFSVIPNNSSFIITTGHQRGVIKTKKPLDRETTARYDLVLKVSDRGTPPRTATSTLHIVVEDMNDNPPYFSHSGQYLGEVEEHQPNGTEVIRVLADDPDNGENGTITYRLVTSTPGMNGEEMFNIHPHSGLITTNAPLDREQKPTYVLSVAAVDGGTPSLERTTLVHIHVTDSNDNAPVFVNSTISIEVEEGLEAGTTIGSVHALDNDEGENGRVSYEIMQGNLYGTFGVDRNTGRIFTAKELDFELNSHYRLIVQAQDNNARSQQSSTIYVNINVIDINDNAPKFRSDPVMFGLQENTAVNSTVWTFSATDVDSGRNGAVRYRIMDQLPNGNNFRIDPVTGALETTTTIDREQTSQFTLVVEATDQPVNSSHARTKTTTARILVEDVNDNTPVFVSRTETYVMEDEPVGYHVMYVIAVDDDYGDNGRVTYQIISGNQGGKFLLDPNTGLLAIERRLDRETESQYILNVTATDHGTPSRSASHLITIHVRDVNDNQPRFLQDTYMASVSENQNPGTSVIQITALDADAGTNGVLTYNIPRGVAEDRFTIEEQTGVIRTAFRLDREEKDSYVVTAYARDGAYPSRFGFTSVVVSVLDTNDHAPVFKDAEYFMTVPENQQSYGIIHTVVAYDADIGTNGQVRYEIIDGNTGGKFAVDAVTGQLSVVSALDRENVPLYHLIIQAHDNTASPLRSTTNITIAVSDENDNNPIFTDPSYHETIQEDVAVGTTVTRVTAQDRDEGVNGEVFYFLSNETNGMFRIDNTSGIITTTRLLDREKQSMYSFDAYASDRGPFGPRTSNVRVTVEISDVNDNAPVFTQVPFETTIDRNIGVNQNVLTVTAEDKDTGSNAQILYRFDHSNPDSTKFSIDAQSGVITTQVSLISDLASGFRLQVIAEDQGTPARSSTGVVVITMSDSSMTTLRFDNGTYSAYISENAAANTDIISVSASREDGVPAVVSYSFASGNDDESFEITTNNGQGLIKVKDSTNLDFEMAPRVRLIVTAQATTPSLYGYATVWVNLRDENDNAPRFVQDRYTTSVWEGNDRGMYVIQVSATDADSGTNAEVQYSIVSGNHDNAFVIDMDRGIVSTNVRMDREVRDSYRLELRAVDRGTPRLTGSATLRISVVDINDNRPTFPEPYPPVNVPEGAEVGSELAMVTANDIDTDPTITYDFTPNGNPGGMFSIDRYSGKVTLAQPLDRETMQRYVITIVASDEVHTDQTNVEINILDENDNPPVFDQQTYQVDIAEMVPPHYSVATVTATDRDAGSNAEITYSMTVAPVEGFYVDPRNGTIFTNKTIEINRMQSNIQLVIEARDHGTPSLASVVAVRIQVNDINNHAPQFSAGQYEEHISEDASRGTTVATVTATDDDQSHDNSNIHFGIVQGNDDGKFQIETIEPSSPSDQYMGKIILFQDLDREEVPSYTLTVLASDRGTPERNSTVLVYVIVDDINDHSPMFNSTQYIAQISEEAPVGAFVVRVFAFDADSGPNADIHYEITSGNDNGLFNINSQTGVITVANQLDYDTVAQHNLTIRAQDSTSDGAKHTITSVLINLIDENDNPPDFPVLMYLEDVREGEPIGTLVFTAKARDKDAGVYGTLSYVILDRDVPSDGTSDVAQGKNAFEIDSSTGEVRTREVFDYETQDTYGFYIRATDTGGLSTDVQVGVSIQSVDEYPPEFTKANYNFEVMANAEIGTVVGQVEATDRDGGVDGIVVYSIRSGSDKFAINESGVITVKASLLENDATATGENRRKRRQTENEDQINLIVEASSGRPGSQSEVKAISIAIDRSCDGCMPAAQTNPLSPLTPLSLALILIFALIALILCVVLVVLKFKRRKQRPPPTFDGSFDTVVVPNTHSFGRDGSQKQSQQLRIFNGHPSFTAATADNSGDMGTLTRTDISEHSNNSQSSGRGSSEVDEDEEIRKINETPASISPHSDQHKVREIPDSGIQHDEDAMSEMSVKDTADLISRLAVNSAQGSHLNTMISKSVESMHVFRDEGGGEAGGDMDIGNLIHQKLHEVGMEENEAIMDGTRDFVLIDDGQPSVAGSLSSIVASEEELRGSYNWDYLLDWGPQYQPMADVFLEIAKLKDETVAKRQIHHPKSAFTPKVRTHPPPLITNLPQSSSSTIAPIALGGSSRTSQATSISSLPRSPISHESTFTSPALTPSFSPSLSPLATRSPSVSPLVTGPNSGASTPHRRSAYSSTFMTRVPSPTGSEQELRI